MGRGQTDGHVDSLTNSAQRAELVKIAIKKNIKKNMQIPHTKIRNKEKYSYMIQLNHPCSHKSRNSPYNMYLNHVYFCVAERPVSSLGDLFKWFLKRKGFLPRYVLDFYNIRQKD